MRVNRSNDLYDVGRPRLRYRKNLRFDPVGLPYHRDPREVKRGNEGDSCEPELAGGFGSQPGWLRGIAGLVCLLKVGGRLVSWDCQSCLPTKDWWATGFVGLLTYQRFPGYLLVGFIKLSVPPIWFHYRFRMIQDLSFSNLDRSMNNFVGMP